MQRSRFLSSISVLLLAGCGDDDCGPGDAPAVGLVASSAEVTLSYGNLSSLAGNDCPAADAPPGVISVSIEGAQSDGPGLLTFCIPRPDLLEQGVTIGSGLRIVDFNGEKDGCELGIAQGSVPTGTARATGICDNGKNKAGFALTLQGNLVLRRTCPTATDMIAVALAGTVAVTSRDP